MSGIILFNEMRKMFVKSRLRRVRTCDLNFLAEGLQALLLPEDCYVALSD